MDQALLWKRFRDLSTEKGQMHTNLSTKKPLAKFPSTETRKYQAFSSTTQSFFLAWKQCTSTLSGDFKLGEIELPMPTQDAHLGLQAGSESIGQKQARETSAQVVSSYGLISSTQRLESAHKNWSQGVLDLCVYATYQNTKMHTKMSQCVISHQNINKHAFS